ASAPLDEPLRPSARHPQTLRVRRARGGGRGRIQRVDPRRHPAPAFVQGPADRQESSGSSLGGALMPRSIWSGSIRFWLWNVPVELITAVHKKDCCLLQSVFH